MCAKLFDNRLSLHSRSKLGPFFQVIITNPIYLVQAPDYKQIQLHARCGFLLKLFYFRKKFEKV